MVYYSLRQRETRFDDIFSIWNSPSMSLEWGSAPYCISNTTIFSKPCLETNQKQILKSDKKKQSTCMFDIIFCQIMPTYMYLTVKHNAIPLINKINKTGQSTDNCRTLQLPDNWCNSLLVFWQLLIYKRVYNECFKTS